MTQKEFKDCNIGDLVSFEYSGKKITGTIINNNEPQNILHIDDEESLNNIKLLGSYTSVISNFANKFIAKNLGISDSSRNFLATYLIKSNTKVNVIKKSKLPSTTNPKCGDEIKIYIHGMNQLIDAIYLGDFRGFPVAWIKDKFISCWKCSISSYKNTDLPNVLETLGLDKESSNCYDGEFHILEITKRNSNSSIKNDLKQAGLRILSTQVSSAVKTAAIAALSKEGMEKSKLDVVKEIFETPFGDALISYFIGQGLTHMPFLKENDKVISLAKEFRVNGMAVAGNQIIDSITQYIIPALKDTIKSLPEDNKDQKFVLLEEKVIITQEK